VEEYYLYDPEPAKNELTGFLRQGERLRTIDEVNGWSSPRLGIRFDTSGAELRIFAPDGQLFVSFSTLQQRTDRMAAKLRELGIDPETLESGEAESAES
jgi:non-ribosomal peptide synthetase component E (peptide arylation enzyme)